MAHLLTLPDGTIELHDVWGYDDVNNVQSCRDEPELTDKQCKAVLELVANTFDADIGVNWDVLENAIDEVLKRGV